MPSMMVYQLKTANNQLDTDWVKNIDTSVLHIDFKYALILPRTMTISHVTSLTIFFSLQTRCEGTPLSHPGSIH